MLKRELWSAILCCLALMTARSVHALDLPMASGASPAQLRGSSTIDVKSAFNAKADGSDDSDAVMKAWKAAQRQNGRPCRNLYFPAGTYYLPRMRQVRMTPTYQGCQWIGDGSGVNAASGSASVLRFDYHPARVALSSLRDEHGTVHATTASPHGFVTGDAVFVLTPIDAHYNALHVVTVQDSTHFTYRATRKADKLSACDGSCGDASDAVVLVFDGANHVGFQNLTIQGASEDPKTGIFAAGLTDDAVKVASCCNLFSNVSTPGWRYFFAETSDLDGTIFLHLDGVGGGCFYSYWNQGNLINFVGSNLNCYDNPDASPMDYDFNGPGFELFGGYVASAASRGNTPNYCIHYLPTFGGGSPLAAYGTHWEPYGKGGRIIKDDSLDASKVIHLEDDAIGGDSTGTLVQVTDKSHVDLVNIAGLSPGQVELDTNRLAMQPGIWAPSLRWIGQTNGSMPSLKSCDRTSPPSGCAPVAPGDPTQPTYTIEGVRAYAAKGETGEQHVYGGPAPTLSSCGSNPVVLTPSTDLGFRFTGGGGATSCDVVFAGRFANVPVVTCNDETHAKALRVSPSNSRAAVSGFRRGDTVACSVTPY